VCTENHRREPRFVFRTAVAISGVIDRAIADGIDSKKNIKTGSYRKILKKYFAGGRFTTIAVVAHQTS